MKLKVSKIVFLASGKLSVEIYGAGEDNPPKPPALDNVRLHVYMEFDRGDTIGNIMTTAVRIAEEGMGAIPAG